MLKRTLLRNLDHLLNLNSSSIAVYARAAEQLDASSRLRQSVLIQEVEDAIHFGELSDFVAKLGVAPATIDWDTPPQAVSVTVCDEPKAILEALIATKTRMCTDYRETLQGTLPKPLKELLHSRHAQLLKHATSLASELSKPLRLV